ncbi:Putative transcriptional regulator, TetR family [Mycobacteroides abscessus subsp. abscessus]|nr:TetR family transcriptional regulator [Mycobacteroides abscessus]SHS89932.1 Putative transcriptional regulator, TetR family [Mycobacteroides abscessus subsp. abscessus]CPR90634.1 Putative transcriptional regulator%2C TetR family [Mycobacteroides abscessus]SIC76527.1 Putative transcriptional regulator, TetR family [Mycobacteroides abscessus subsp. abscessus]SIL14392.1 Putative transcriptional regulator, TetR family [Mycobacteroides abscessus subsp. abscessus]
MRKALTREELQAQTRDLVLSAAERVFLQRGFHATTVAQIAAEAGRTQGSIYSNFESKDALCQQLLRNHYEGWLSQVALAVMAAENTPAKLDIVESKWRVMSAETDWIGLTAEYLLAVRHDPQQAQLIRENVAALQAGAKAVFTGQLEAEGFAVQDHPMLDDAVAAIVATGMGLVVNHTLGLVEPDQSTSVFMQTLETWRDRLIA